MPDPSSAATLLFLREEELRQGLELLFFAGRDLAAETDLVLAEHGLTQAHQRVLHFTASEPQITVSELLDILHLTKQTLSRLTRHLIALGLLTQRPGQRDRRQRHLVLTERGRALERSLWERQRQRIAKAYREAGSDAIEGCRRVLIGLVDPADRPRFDRISPAGGAR